MNTRILQLPTIAGALGLLSACASTLPAHFGSDVSAMSDDGTIKYCSPGSALVREIHGDRLLSPARPYDGGTCK